MRQHAGSFFFQWSTVLRIGACAIQRKQADVLLGYVLGTCTPPLLMLPRWMTLRKSLVSRPVRTIRVSRGGLEPRAIRLPGWRHSRNRRGRWEWGWLRNTKILNLIKPCSPSNWSVRTSGHLDWQKSRNLSWWLSLLLRRGTSNITKRVLTLALHFRVLVES